jgi:hypothetical protein
MAFFVRQDIGKLYVIKMFLPDETIVYKIGMTKTTDRVTDRMMEILKSWFTRYRFVPYCELKLNKETSVPKELESHIHKILKVKRFIPTEKVDGGTEMFINIDEFRVLHYLRTFNDELLRKPLNLTDEDYTHLCQLISP